MWRQLLTLSALLVISKADVSSVHGNNRYTISESANNKLNKIMYNHMNVLNEINDMEDDTLKKNPRIGVSESVRPLSAVDVKCLMSADRFCTTEMGQMKNVLIQAVQENCIRCSVGHKEEAGKMILSMMAHHPAAWKLFLTRYGALHKVNIDQTRFVL